MVVTCTVVVTMVASGSSWRGCPATVLMTLPPAMLGAGKHAGDTLVVI
jgi:hypothetical protein